MKPHLCVDARMLEAPGIGRVLNNALSSLAQSARYKLTLLCYASQAEESSLFTQNLILMRSRVYSLQEQCELPAKIPPCDLFWAPHFNIPLLPIRAKKRLTLISDVYHLAHASQLSLPKRVYAKFFYNAAFALSDKVITISRFSQSEILKFARFKPKDLEIVPPAFDFAPPLNSFENKTDKFLLAVSTLKPHKNLLRLVQAYARLRISIPLFIVGKKEGLHTQDKEVLNLVQNDPFLKEGVHFLGYVSDEKLKKLYSEAAAFIFPSTYEGFGFPPLEAMACGCPVVASQAASIPEVCGDSALYVDPYSIDSIAEGISRVLSDRGLRGVLQHKGRVRSAQKKNEKNRILEVIDACCRCS